jgi:hypothetical protein
MATTRRKATKNQAGTPGEPAGAFSLMPPTSNTGRTSSDLEEGGGTKRERLNLSLSPQVREAVSTLAGMLGMTDSQLVLHALMQALPDLERQALVVAQLGKVSVR